MLLRPIATPEINPLRRPLARIAGRPAFTLLEVLVVVAILVILASVGAFATLGYLERAKISQAKLQMSKIEQACNAYYAQNSTTWPPSLNDLITPPNALLVGGQPAILDPWGQPYQMSIVPDQTTGQERVRIHSNGGGQQPIDWPAN